MVKKRGAVDHANLHMWVIKVGQTHKQLECIYGYFNNENIFVCVYCMIG